jgi:hypothetical protein
MTTNNPIIEIKWDDQEGLMGAARVFLKSLEDSLATIQDDKARLEEVKRHCLDVAARADALMFHIDYPQIKTSINK